MLPKECLSHPWLANVRERAQKDVLLDQPNIGQPIPTDKLRRYNIRRRFRVKKKDLQYSQHLLESNFCCDELLRVYTNLERSKAKKFNQWARVLWKGQSNTERDWKMSVCYPSIVLQRKKDSEKIIHLGVKTRKCKKAIYFEKL